MSQDEKQLVEEYFRAGTLSGLPDRHFIDGEWIASSDGERMQSFDPGSGRAFHEFAAGSVGDVDRAMDAARCAQKGWGRKRASERGLILARAAELIHANAARLAVVECLDCGKPLQEAEVDVAGAARCFELYADAADKLQGDTFPLGPDHIGYSYHQPLGVTAHIIPWNYPLSTAARGVAPALAAGCTVVAKPAEQTPLTALMLADILHQADLFGWITAGGRPSRPCRDGRTTRGAGGEADDRPWSSPIAIRTTEFHRTSRQGGRLSQRRKGTRHHGRHRGQPLQRPGDRPGLVLRAYHS